jgi:hypothetical protein
MPPHTPAKPNNASELTAHSAGFLAVLGVVSCGPQLTASVRLRNKIEEGTCLHWDKRGISLQPQKEDHNAQAGATNRDWTQ